MLCFCVCVCVRYLQATGASQFMGGSTATNCTPSTSTRQCTGLVPSRKSLIPKHQWKRQRSSWFETSRWAMQHTHTHTQKRAPPSVLFPWKPHGLIRPRVQSFPCLPFSFLNDLILFQTTPRHYIMTDPKQRGHFKIKLDPVIGSPESFDWWDLKGCFLLVPSHTEGEWSVFYKGRTYF